MQQRNALPRTKARSLAAGLALIASCGLQAADHQEAPGATAQLSADIGDYYAWHADGQLNLIVTFGTFSAPGMEAAFDESVLYGMHFDTSETPDAVSDFDLYVRFAQNVDGDWGLRVSDASDTSLIEGAVDTVLSGDDIAAYAGLADDPFFFNASGFNETISTGVISFDPTQDDVAGLNITVLAVQLPVETVMPGGGALQTWATTASQ